MFKPSIISWDVETSAGGKGSTEFYRHDFRVDSMAATWRDAQGDVVSIFIEGEEATGVWLADICERQVPLAIHNWQFERGVVTCRYPHLIDKMPPVVDTMRLVQNFDNGGGDAFEIVSLGDELDAVDDVDEYGEPKKKSKVRPLSGLGLVIAARRLLKITESHKEEAHAWLRENVEGCRKGKEGGFLTHLPRDILERYNIADTEITLKLYEFTTEYFRKVGFDWTADHRLFMPSVTHLVDAKIRGIRVDRESLSANIEIVKDEIAVIERDFRATFAKEIAVVERQRLLAAVRKRRTLRGRRAFMRKFKLGDAAACESAVFNVGSNAQLATLFQGVCKIECRFFTAKGAPSFRSTHLGAWGPGGVTLQTRRKRQIVQKQMEAIYELSAYDGRVRPDIKACGTATGRYSAGQHG